jgi:NRPS condensation-like uncharacterized protein
MTNKRYPLSAQDQMNAITRVHADQQIHLAIQFTGRLDEALLEKALHLMIASEPVLGCRFIEAGKKALWEGRSDLDALQLSRVIPSTDPQADMLAFVITPSDPALDPLVQARIFRSSSNDLLCIKVNHVVADGAGAREIGYLLAEMYRRLQSNPNMSLTVGKFKKRSSFPIYRQAGLMNVIHHFPRLTALAAGKFTLPFIGKQSTDRTFGVRRIQPDELRSLKTYARSQSATINDVLLSALYRAMVNLGNPPDGQPLPIQVSIDLRRYLLDVKERAICNLSGALFPAPVLNPQDTFEQTLTKVSAEMLKFKSNQPGLGSAILVDLVMGRGFAKGKELLSKATSGWSGKINPLLSSNFGILDPKQLSFGSVQLADAWMYSPIMFGHGLMLGTSTFNDRMTLTIGYCQGMLARQTIEGLLDAIVHELLSVIDSGQKVPAASNLLDILQNA